MESKELIEALRYGAGMGCMDNVRIMADAASELEHLQKANAELVKSAPAENQSCFRLGQMNMREAALEALLDAAEHATDAGAFWLGFAAGIIHGLEVIDIGEG